jgi:hypothetical protein
MKSRLLIPAFIILILISLSWLFYHKSIKEFPRAIHAWAQSDHYALALNFQKNGFDFFHPETYCLNPQFLAEIIPKNENGITRVDFPIHEYMISLLMFISSNSSPLVFRLYILICSLTGLFFLFKITRKLTNSFLFSTFIVIFAFTSPVFVYYQNGFLPGIPSLACLIIAYYFYICYRQTRVFKTFILSCFFFTLAALTRTPFSIFIIALAGQHFLYYLKQRKWPLKEILTFVFSFLIISGYFIYNLYLGKKYGSVFLSSILPPTSWQDAIDILKQIKQNWLFEYFTGWHYIFIIVLVVVSMIMVIIRKIPKGIAMGGWLHFLISGIGVVAYFILMMKQYAVHDYYFLDTFFPLCLLGLILVFMTLPSGKKGFSIFSFIIFFIFSVLFIFQSFNIQEKRYQPNPSNPFEAQIIDFENSKSFLNSADIPQNARMLVLNSCSPNIPLILMDRKGYSLFGWQEKEATRFYDRNWDYAVIQETMPVSDMFEKDFDFYTRIERIASNGQIALYRRSQMVNTNNIEDFLGFKDSNIFFRDKTGFDIDSLNKDKPYLPLIVKNKFHSSPNSVLLLPESEFLEMLNAPVVKVNCMNVSRILISGWFNISNPNDNSDFDLVVTLSDNSGTYLYNSFSMADYLKKNTDQWQYLAFQFALPKPHSPKDNLKVYFWNKNRIEFYADDISIISGN